MHFVLNTETNTCQPEIDFVIIIDARESGWQEWYMYKIVLEELEYVLIRDVIQITGILGPYPLS